MVDTGGLGFVRQRGSHSDFLTVVAIDDPSATHICLPAFCARQARTKAQGLVFSTCGIISSGQPKS
jgi:hypothetical protein